MKRFLIILLCLPSTIFGDKQELVGGMVISGAFLGFPLYKTAYHFCEARRKVHRFYSNRPAEIAKMQTLLSTNNIEDFEGQALKCIARTWDPSASNQDVAMAFDANITDDKDLKLGIQEFKDNITKVKNASTQQAKDEALLDLAFKLDPGINNSIILTHDWGYRALLPGVIFGSLAVAYFCRR